VTQPTPAIVTQGAARRLPRWALLLFCVAYVVPGFIGREPWKAADMTALGYMFEMAQGTSSWLAPRLVGHPPEFDALLPYWLGAWAMQLAPAWIPPDFAARLPFIALLVLTLLSTWYGVYHLARSPRAQPVAFAFGGEASAVDYARAMADAALLALIACLGLAQFSHETTPSLAQLAFTALTFYGVAALPYRRVYPALALAAGLAGLALSGAATLAALFALGALLVAVLAHPEDAQLRGTKWRWAALIAVIALSVAALATSLDAWRWRVTGFSAVEWRRVGRMLVWFTWPAWPLALWTIWRWRRQLTSRHVLLPLWITAVTLATALLTPTPDRSLLLSLPALATLAAFALPTFKRSVASLIDWFTLLFFSGAAIVIWVVWISLQTGVPAKPAANVAKLAPGFEPSFSFITFLAALAGTAAWAWLVSWRTGRHREAIWKSLVLPAGGAALCWLLMMTLWLPVLDYARSYVPVVQSVTRMIDPPGCVQVLGLNRGQLAAFRYHARLDLQPAGPQATCGWLLLPQDLQASLPLALDARQWQLVASVRRPADAKDNVLLYRKVR
jgi:4-amino-4-deoxy-L-arabinose transferase-like glycosyltransferase